MALRTHKDLDVWKKAIKLVTNIYRVTEGFPNNEIYGITSQIRRSVISIPSNIAEGSARNGDRDFLRFLNIAMGSHAELETQLIIANNLEYLNDEDFTSLMSANDEIGRMLAGLINYQKKKLK